MAEINIDKLRDLWKDSLARKYIMAVGILVLSLLYFVTLVLPAIVSLTQVSREVRDSRQRVDSARKKIIRMAAMKGKLSKLENELSDLSANLPEKKEITALLEEFALIASRSDVKILSIIPYDLQVVKTGTKDRFYEEMPIRITAKSGYHQLGKFVSSLTSGERLISIDNVEITNDKQSPRMNDVLIMLKTYVSVGEG